MFQENPDSRHNLATYGTDDLVVVQANVPWGRSNMANIK